MLTLHTLPASRAKRKNRVGRGNASGGNYSGRGMKGQRARSGGKGGLKLRGLKQSLMAIPKKRGFVSPYPAAQVVNLGQLNQFPAGTTVDVAALLAAGLVRTRDLPIKILGRGTIDRALTVRANAASASAQAAIRAAGGTVTAVSFRRTQPKVAQQADKK